MIFNASSFVIPPFIYLSRACDASSRQFKYSSKDIPLGTASIDQVVLSYRLYIFCLVCSKAFKTGSVSTAIFCIIVGAIFLQVFYNKHCPCFTFKRNHRFAFFYCLYSNKLQFTHTNPRTAYCLNNASVLFRYKQRL